MNSLNWNYFDKFEGILNKYMEDSGEGNTKASQIVTAVNKLIYKWYNDGDVYDNTYYLTGWANDLSSFANWLENYTEEGDKILSQIFTTRDADGYEMILKELADTFLNEDTLSKYAKKEKEGTIYECIGSYKFEEYQEEWYE